MYLIGKNENHAHAIQFLVFVIHIPNTFTFNRIIKIYGRPIFLIPWIPFAEEFNYTLNNIENSFYSLFIKYIPKITI